MKRETQLKTIPIKRRRQKNHLQVDFHVHDRQSSNDCWKPSVTLSDRPRSSDDRRTITDDSMRLQSLRCDRVNTDICTGQISAAMTQPFATTIDNHIKKDKHHEEMVHDQTGSRSKTIKCKTIIILLSLLTFFLTVNIQQDQSVLQGDCLTQNVKY